MDEVDRERRRLLGVVTAVLFLGEVLRGGQVVGAVTALSGMWLAASNPSFNRRETRS